MKTKEQQLEEVFKRPKLGETSQCNIYINNKTGDEYGVLNKAINATNGALCARMVVYQDMKGKLFVREMSEFLSKFTKKEINNQTMTNVYILYKYTEVLKELGYFKTTESVDLLQYRKQIQGTTRQLNVSISHNNGNDCTAHVHVMLNALVKIEATVDFDINKQTHILSFNKVEDSIINYIKLLEAVTSKE